MLHYLPHTLSHRSSLPPNLAKNPAMSSSEQVRASHILIKHEGSRRKSSWKDPEGRRISATTRDSAVAQLKTIRDDILAGKSKFDDVASRVSDCSSAKRGGDLGMRFVVFIVPVELFWYHIFHLMGVVLFYFLWVLYTLTFLVPILVKIFWNFSII